MHHLFPQSNLFLNTRTKLASGRRSTITENEAFLMRSSSLSQAIMKYLPSRLTREYSTLELVVSRISESPSTTSGLIVNECGAIGDNTAHSKVGIKIGPPTERL